MNSKIFVPRTCIEISAERNSGAANNLPATLEDYRIVDAYVLLGAPGVGKSTSFLHEVESNPEEYCFVSARDFIDFSYKPEWRDKVLFIDGLDEINTGTSGGRSQFGKICKNLYSLKCKQFRLSCRDIEWFRTNYKESLERGILDNAKVIVLRLEPLSDDGIHEFLKQNINIQNIEEFIGESKTIGIDSLLANPQSLEMLAKIVGNKNSWPESRTETFELACKTLPRECNQNYCDAETQDLSDAELMDIAGFLSAVQLLAGRTGFTPAGHEISHEAIDVREISDKKFKLRSIRHTLNTKLFKVEDCVVPTHRNIAEFLAARYLASLIDKGGLPLQRVLALMTGNDGGIVSNLSGLAAWLASHSNCSRAEIVERDPVGTILYGDIRKFSVCEKRLIFDSLHNESRKDPWSWTIFESNPAIGELVSVGMEQYFREFLQDRRRDDERQSFVKILLNSLKYGQEFPEQADLVMEIVRDEKWKSGIRHTALDVFIRYSNRFEPTGQLKKLLNDLYAGTVSDPDDELLGNVLCALYPDNLNSSEIWKYLFQPKEPVLFAKYFEFWYRHVVETSSGTQLISMLDSAEDVAFFGEGFDRLRPLWIRKIPIKLLSRILVSSTERITPDQLHRWLGLVSDIPDFQQDYEDVKRVRNWLTQNPEMQKELILVSMEQRPDSDDFRKLKRSIERRLFGAEAPVDFGSWCLEQAMTRNDRIQIKFFLEKALNSEVSQLVNFQVASHTIQESVYQEIQRERNSHLVEAEQHHAKETKRRSEFEKQEQTRQQDWHTGLMPYLTAMRGNRCPPNYLHHLALVYYGRYMDVQDDSPSLRIKWICNDDIELHDAVMQAFRSSIKRNDLPDVAEILKLESRKQNHYLALPYLAGLDEITKSAPPSEISLDEKQSRLALAFYYTTADWVDPNHSGAKSPKWLSSLLSSSPDLVSDFIVHWARLKFRNKEIPDVLNKLALDQDYAEVASLVGLKLLNLFPVYCKNSQLGSLNYLLQASIQFCEKAQLLELIRRKIASKSITVAQKIYWLATGLIVEPEDFCGKLISYLKKDERRIRHFTEFAVNVDKSIWLSIQENSSVLEKLIKLIGSSYRPFEHSKSTDWISIAKFASNCIRGFIDQLASNSSQSAGESLQSLSEDLPDWQRYLTDAQHRQRIIRREAEFCSYSIEKVLETLSNNKPANSTDLAALAVDCIKNIGNDISNGNSSGWRDFWNFSGRNPERPRIENLCRDTLMGKLCTELRHLGISVHKEVEHTDDKRSDMLISYDGYNVPVEVKKSDSRDLWSAIQEQLIRKYTRDPNSNGYGILLVFWFGRDCCQNPDSGKLPNSADELRNRLLDALTSDEKRRISVCVIDVSIPQA